MPLDSPIHNLRGIPRFNPAETCSNILNYRSINDSSDIKVSKVTTLVGRNESGKTNLLLALRAMNPARGRKDLLPIKDFPRHRRLSECTDTTEVVHTTWEFSPDEQAKLTSIFPRAAGVTHVEIRRHYKAAELPVEFLNLSPIDFDIEQVKTRVDKIASAISAAAEKLEDAPRQQLGGAVEQLNTALTTHIEPNAWAKAAAPGLASFRQIISNAGIVLEAREDGLVAELEDLAAVIGKDAPALAAAKKWALSLMPVFIYVEDYPELVGHQNIAEYLGRLIATLKRCAGLLISTRNSFTPCSRPTTTKHGIN